MRKIIGNGPKLFEISKFCSRDAVFRIATFACWKISGRDNVIVYWHFLTYRSLSYLVLCVGTSCWDYCFHCRQIVFYDVIKMSRFQTREKIGEFKGKMYLSLDSSVHKNHIVSRNTILTVYSVIWEVRKQSHFPTCKCCYSENCIPGAKFRNLEEFRSVSDDFSHKASEDT